MADLWHSLKAFGHKNYLASLPLKSSDDGYFIGSVNFSRSSTQNIRDWEGILRNIPDSTPAYEGARIVTNYAKNSDRPLLWNRSGGVTIENAGGGWYKVSFASSADWLRNYSTQIQPIGSTCIFSITAMAGSLSNITLADPNNGGIATRSLLPIESYISSNPYIVNGINSYGQISSTIPGFIYVKNQQFENITGQSIQLASPYIPSSGLFQEGTVNLSSQTIEIYNNSTTNHPATKEILAETYLGQPITRITFTAATSAGVSSIRGTTGNHGCHVARGVWPGNTDEIASIYWRCNTPSVVVDGIPSNIQGWKNAGSDIITSEWKRSRIGRYFRIPQTDTKHWGFRDPNCVLGQVYVIDWCCPQVEQKDHVTPYVNGTRADTIVDRPVTSKAFNTTRVFQEGTTNLISSLGIDISQIRGYTDLLTSKVVEPLAWSGYALQMQLGSTLISTSSRAGLGDTASIPTSGNAFFSITVKSIDSTAIIRPSVYSGSTWTQLLPLDGGSEYLSNNPRRFGNTVPLGTLSGGPLPCFSMTNMGVTNDLIVKTIWYDPQLELKNHSTPFTSGTRLDAAVTGPIIPSIKGYLSEISKTNLLTFSNDFSNAVWTKQAVTIVTNAIIGPFGEMNALKLLGTNGTNSSTSYIHQNITVSGLNTISVYAKAGEYQYVRLNTGAYTGNRYAIFDLSNGTITQSSGDVNTTETIISVGNGWYRISLTSSSITSSYSLLISPANAPTGNGTTNNGTSGIYIYGAQLESGNFYTSYINTTTGSSTRAATKYLFQTIQNIPTTGTWSIPLVITPNVSSGSITSPQCILGSYKDANNYLRLWINSAIIYLEKVVGGVKEYVTCPFSAISGVSAGILVRRNEDGTINLFVNGVRDIGGFSNEILTIAQQNADSGYNIANDVGNTITVNGKINFNNSPMSVGLIVAGNNYRILKATYSIESITGSVGTYFSTNSFSTPGNKVDIFYNDWSSGCLHLYTKTVGTTAVIDNLSLKEIYNNTTYLQPVLGDTIEIGSDGQGLNQFCGNIGKADVYKERLTEGMAQALSTL